MVHRTSSLLDDAAAGRSPQQQVIDRVRFVVMISIVGATLFAARELIVDPQFYAPRFAIRLVGIAMAVAGVIVLGRPSMVRWAWPLAIAGVSLAYVLTALAGVVAPTHEYATTAVLFVGAALTTATMIPWGFLTQCASMVIAVSILAFSVFWKDGSLLVLASEPGVAVLMGFVFAAVTAREFDSYRVSHHRELEERRRAEEALRRLNLHLEDRVVERTTTLQTVNDLLAAEIAERRRANDALRASEALLADTVDNSTAIVSLKDVRGRYLLVNREFENVLGQPRLSVVGRRDADLFPAALAERLGARDAEVLSGGTPVSFEQDLTVGSVPRTYVCVKFLLHSGDGAPYGVGSMATDITVLKQLQEELRRHQDELAHVLRRHSIGEMIATLAHQINQPLGAISNFAHGGARRVRASDVDPPELLNAFEQIGAEALRAGQILRTIRSLVRRDDIAGSPVDVNALAGEAMRVLEPQARLHGVTVRLEGGSDIPTVQANPAQIEQVLVNLMLNGVEASATPAGARREVVVATERSGDGIEVTVRDFGHGIAPGMADRLFTPFATTKAHGLGLGLAISRSIVENHGGRLWAAPNPGPGATFRFSLPVDHGHAA